MTGDKEILAGCINGKQAAQRQLFDKYSRLLLGVCNRYAQSIEEAEDILQDGFVKIFLNIKDFKGEGSLLAWMRKIMVNTAITNYYKTRKHRYHDDLEEVSELRFGDHTWDEADFTGEELMKVIRQMPQGYRIVFGLYAMEGFKHREIAEILDIDENTSKSQYSRARRWLQERLIKLEAGKRTPDG